MKKCPYCAEEIQDEAIVCRYCLHEFWPTPRRARSTARRLMSAIEYALHWLKINNPEVYKEIVAKMAEAEGNPTPLKTRQKQPQTAE